jgi:peptidoglycan/xylan/chitin deacetylase (PgdA/CDA1 family)
VTIAVVIAAGGGGASPGQPAASKHAPRHASRHPVATARSLPEPPAEVRGAAARRMRIPILMYHVVAVPKPGTPNLGLWVTPGTFASEMAALRRAGFHGITLRHAYDAWHGRAPLPRRPVVVSFDDGYLGDYTNVRPVLQRMGWPGVLNLEFRNLGRGGITSRQVRALIAAGWEIDSHTIDHVDLTTVGADQLRFELVASRSRLRKRFGVPADFFCYPAGRYNDRVVAAVKAAGYLAATTTNEGYADGSGPFTLARVRVNNTDDARSLLAKLASERPHAAVL